MAIGINGMGYSKLEVPKDGLSESLQFWGAEAGKRKAAADLANERARVRKEEAAAKAEAERKADVKSKDYTWTPQFSNFGSHDDMSMGLANTLSERYSNYKMEYDKASKVSDAKAMNQWNNKMEALKREASRFDSTSKNLKTAHETLFKANQDGTMSSFYQNSWNKLDKLVTGSSAESSAEWDDKDRIVPTIKQINEDGTTSVVPVYVEDFVEGTLSNVSKFDTDAAVAALKGDMGSFKQTSYARNRDITTEGYNLLAEKQLRSVIKNRITDANVKAWAGENLGATLEDFKANPAKIAEWRKAAEEDLYNRVMGDEAVVSGSKLNLSEAELAEKIRANKADEAIRKAKPEAKKDEVVEMAQRVSYDAEQAIGKGDVSGIIGVIITSPDKKTKKTSISATDLGNEFVVKFDDGTTQRVPKTKQGVVNYIAQSDNLAVGRDKGLVETAIRERGIAYERPNATTSIGAGFKEGLDAIKKAKVTDDDKASEILQASLPDGWKVKNTSNSWFATEVDIISPDGKVRTVDYTDKASMARVQDDLDKIEQGSSSTIDADTLINKYK